MNTEYDIIMLAIARWDGPYSSTAYSLAKEFSRNNRVFYIDNPFTYKDFYRGRSQPHIQLRKEALLRGKNIYRNIEGLPQNFTAVTPRLTLPINWLPEGPLYRSLLNRNDRVVTEVVSRIIRDFEVKRYVFINNWNPFFGRKLPHSLKPDLYVYQNVDDMSQAPYVAKHGPRLEREMIERADFVTATSQELVRLMANAQTPVHYLPNAADIGLFRKAAEQSFPRPPELRGLEGKKIIGYTGAISIRIDYELLKKLALVHQDKILLMVGPKGEHYEEVGLDDMPNVIFTGRKDISELPAYLHYMDCTIIPFRCTKLTKSIYPLKINEYLAAGKPVVSTCFSDDINDFAGIAQIAVRPEEFVSMVGKAIDEDHEEARRHRMAVAQTNTWEARVAAFWDLVHAHLGDRKQDKSGKPGLRKLSDGEGR
ncbi:MAG: glycosyltransferase family 1 protein [Bacteroidetes bacterium]|nr:MAG: glycosyltransferase family 1 protein [Bacteroidota bacterium]